MNHEVPQKNPMEGDLPDAGVFLRKHRTPLVVGACAVVLALLCPALYHLHARKKIQRASMMLSSARAMEDLDTLVAKYPATPAAPLALIKTAKLHFDSGNYDVALSKYAEFKKQFSKHPMAPAADLGRIHCIEARGQIEEALQAFAAFSRENPTHFLTSQAILGEARCLKQLGKLHEAKALYEDFIVGRANSAWIPRVKELLIAVDKEIEKTAPEITPTNTMPHSTATTTQSQSEPEIRPKVSE